MMKKIGHRRMTGSKKGAQERKPEEITDSRRYYRKIHVNISRSRDRTGFGYVKIDSGEFPHMITHMERTKKSLGSME